MTIPVHPLIASTVSWIGKQPCATGLQDAALSTVVGGAVQHITRVLLTGCAPARAAPIAIDNTTMLKANSFENLIANSPLSLLAAGCGNFQSPTVQLKSGEIKFEQAQSFRLR
jgi:hypothetical protein